MVQNKGIIFKSVPTGWPKPGENLTIETRDFDLNTQPPKDGITTKNYYISFDPYQRGRMRDPSIESYSPPFALGEPITNSGICKVLKSDNPKFKEGDIITAMVGTEEYSIVPANVVNSTARRIDNQYNLDLKLFLGALGMPGLTAYSSFYKIGEPKQGETIFISAASGPVGQMVGQLAKHEGLTVYGSVGDDKKLEFIEKELNFDGGFNYKKEKPSDALKRLAPKGIDIYYENVGGEQLEAAIGAMNNYGRIVACGMVSQYNLTPDKLYGVKNLMNFVAKRLKMQGFIVGDPDFGPKYAAEHQKNMQKWLHEGTFKAKTSVTEGIDNGIDGLLGMFEGKNFGKAVLKIADLDDKWGGN
ncbi:MAG: hypothetical protein M1835_003604 [Candelina submexicana]|nr:MAG: hypothetical protein M1835_003604 [Candelina submexicana]